jgi:hypothetical protein
VWKARDGFVAVSGTGTWPAHPTAVQEYSS